MENGVYTKLLIYTKGYKLDKEFEVHMIVHQNSEF